MRSSLVLIFLLGCGVPEYSGDWNVVCDDQVRHEGVWSCREENGLVLYTYWGRGEWRFGRTEGECFCEGVL